MVVTAVPQGLGIAGPGLDGGPAGVHRLVVAAERRERPAPQQVRVRIARVEQFRPWPFEESLRKVGFGGLLWSSAVAGIALIDTVVIVLPAAQQHRIAPLSLLFHELVHIEQYRCLGVRGFLRHYLGGWLAAGRSYEGIPLEVQAYELTDRYDADPMQPFSVTAEVRTLAAGA